MSEYLKENEIRVLAVRQPWASLIVEGLKHVELRSKNTATWRKIAIYATKHKPTHKAIDAVRHSAFECDKHKYQKVPSKYFAPYPGASYQTGSILGTVEIYNSYQLELNDFSEAESAITSGFVSKDMIVLGKTCIWKLKNPVKFSAPIPYNPPKGAIVWSKTVLPEGY
jgi:hypothetical protein